ncbi:MAG: hypothetical protein A3C53_05080 [Omnitrophica WOR_2 bacterium RIFCSPHIGHO2_02_FULL_68_15]|nr:MAG: hypothetical protein A3C53_05080 [Omnitrophica WOR_2 bacterium RIFCSPHIGHO2_02_FULL_68_15]
MTVMTSQVALKEWAVVVEAIGRGTQTLLLRKGGVADPDETFQLEHREFFLFPTFEHQKQEQIRAEFHPVFDAVVQRPPPAGHVILPLYAGVAGHWRVESPDDLRGLEQLHIWTPEFLAMRLAYKPEIPTLAVLVRAYRLPKPPMTANIPGYAGCRSWVPLEAALPVEGAVPVVENQVFRATLQHVSIHFGG